MVMARLLREEGGSQRCVDAILADWPPLLEATLARWGEDWQALQAAFEAHRAAWLASDRAGWLQRNQPYPGMVDALSTCDYPLYFASSKAAHRVATLLAAHFGLADVTPDSPRLFASLLPPEEQKAAALRTIGARPVCAGGARKHFVDDRLDTLRAVQRAGGLDDWQLYLADWGYNTAAERAAAAAAPGIRLLSRPAFLELLKWGVVMGVDDGCEPTPEEATCQMASPRSATAAAALLGVVALAGLAAVAEGQSPDPFCSGSALVPTPILFSAARRGGALPQPLAAAPRAADGTLDAKLPSRTLVREGGTYSWLYQQIINLLGWAPCPLADTTKGTPFPTPAGWLLLGVLNSTATFAGAERGIPIASILAPMVPMPPAPDTPGGAAGLLVVALWPGVKAALDALVVAGRTDNIKRVMFAGHSLGGAVATLLAARAQRYLGTACKPAGACKYFADRRSPTVSLVGIGATNAGDAAFATDLGRRVNARMVDFAGDRVPQARRGDGFLLTRFPLDVAPPAAPVTYARVGGVVAFAPPDMPAQPDAWAALTAPAGEAEFVAWGAAEKRMTNDWCLLRDAAAAALANHTYCGGFPPYAIAQVFPAKLTATGTPSSRMRALKAAALALLLGVACVAAQGNSANAPGHNKPAAAPGFGGSGSSGGSFGGSGSSGGSGGSFGGSGSSGGSGGSFGGSGSSGGSGGSFGGSGSSGSTLKALQMCNIMTPKQGVVFSADGDIPCNGAAACRVCGASIADVRAACARTSRCVGWTWQPSARCGVLKAHTSLDKPLLPQRDYVSYAAGNYFTGTGTGGAQNVGTASVEQMCVTLTPILDRIAIGKDLRCGGAENCMVCGGPEAVRDACANRAACIGFSYDTATRCGYLKKDVSNAQTRAGWAIFAR
ncbi:hypothetical protein HT031_003605 [Scenedesmus sp. PABB004]|nr:hypothetical protein HT031_003605 [Scenedesmus sp. PABB004]